jgi:hypothetical protein
MSKESLEMLLTAGTMLPLAHLAMTNIFAYLSASQKMKEHGYERMMHAKQEYFNSIGSGKRMINKIFFGVGDYFAEKPYKTPQ